MATFTATPLLEDFFSPFWAPSGLPYPGQGGQGLLGGSAAPTAGTSGAAAGAADTGVGGAAPTYTRQAAGSSCCIA